MITGGAGSIGAASARLFVDEGARVMLVDVAEARLREVVGELGEAFAAWEVADVSKPRDVERVMESTVRTYGPIDVLFSNAGTMGVMAPIAEYPLEAFDDTLAVHVRGAFLCAKYGLPRMRDGGSMIITSSVAGVRGDAGVYGYITAKHAQVGLMRCLAKEMAPRGIRVNTLHPGPVENSFQRGVESSLTPILGRNATEFFDEIIPLGRHARPVEIARSALYLASEQSSFTTGSLLMVDGGMSA
ncbi:MAG TPA: SDR family oxidoreductase [Candidatus Sulfotelmatobacter sp.]|nr:SDR family oxidoreductase [Candidatus Sulfotelmatobacter sp.]